MSDTMKLIHFMIDQARRDCGRAARVVSDLDNKDLARVVDLLNSAEEALDSAYHELTPFTRNG